MSLVLLVIISLFQIICYATSIDKLSLLHASAFAVRNSSNSLVNGLYLPSTNIDTQTFNVRTFKHMNNPVHLKMIQSSGNMKWMFTSSLLHSRKHGPLIYYAQTKGLYQLPTVWKFSMFQDNPIISMCIDHQQLNLSRPTTSSDLVLKVSNLHCNYTQNILQTLEIKKLREDIKRFIQEVNNNTHVLKGNLRILRRASSISSSNPSDPETLCTIFETFASLIWRIFGYVSTKCMICK